MTPRRVILVVDDETYVRESLAEILKRRGYDPRTASCVREALSPSTLAGVDAVVTDLKMPEDDGKVLLERIREHDPSLPVLILTGHGTVRSAVECVRAGATDYLLKPTDPDELALALERSLADVRRRRELRYLRSRTGTDRPDREPLGVSAAWKRVLELVDAAAPADTPVLLTGESGTGKGEIARLLHRKSRRADGPCVEVNCAAVPVELFESEFFGHRKGAFTGASSDREGRFQVADGGTLVLDEVDSLPATAQAKVLRVIEDGVFERLGESRTTRVDVRLVSASNADLSKAVERGTFRTDLFYRINVMTIPIPPLRERPEDVMVLAEAFLHEVGARLGKRLQGFAPEAREALVTYAWPGNVRELRNVIERGVLLESSDRLTPESLPFDVPDPAPSQAPRGADLHLRRNLHAAERRMLIQALERADGVRREAARLLGVDERNLSYFLRKHDLMGWEPP